MQPRYQQYHYRGGLPVADGAADLAERLLIAEHLPLDKQRVERSGQADVAVNASSGAIAGGVDRGKHRIHRAVRVLEDRARINTLRVVTMVRDDCDGVLRPVHEIARAEVACQMVSQLACGRAQKNGFEKQNSYTSPARGRRDRCLCSRQRRATQPSVNADSSS